MYTKYDSTEGSGQKNGSIKSVLKTADGKQVLECMDKRGDDKPTTKTALLFLIDNSYDRVSILSTT